MRSVDSPEARRARPSIVSAWATIGGVLLGWFFLEAIHGVSRIPPTPMDVGLVLGGVGVTAAVSLLAALLEGLLRRLPPRWGVGTAGSAAATALVLRLVLAEVSVGAVVAAAAGILLGSVLLVGIRRRGSIRFLLTVGAVTVLVSPRWLRLYEDWHGAGGIGRSLGVLVAGGVLIGVGAGPAAERFRRWGAGTRILSILGVFLVGIGIAMGTGNPCTGSSVAGWPPGYGRSPGVVMISIDTLRRDRVPPGGSLPATSSFDRLARDSRRYTRFFSTSGWTLPAHASLFTGALPIRHGAVTQESTIDTGLPFYTRRLQRAGYATAAFTDGGYLHPEYGFDRGFDTFRHYPFESDTAALEPSDPFTPGAAAAARSIRPGQREASPADTGVGIRLRSFPPRHRYFGRIVDRAARWIRRLRPACRPFFLFLHTYQVHDWDRRWGRGYTKNVRRLRREHPDLARAVLRPEAVEPPPPWERELPPGVRERAHRNLTRIPGRDPALLRRRLEELAPDTRAVLYRWLALHSDTPWRQFLGTVLAGEEPLPPLPYPSFAGRRIQYTVLKKWMYAWGDGSRYHDPFRTDPWGRLQALEGLTDTETQRLRSLTEKQLRAYRHLYDYGIQDVDDELGRLMDFLRRRGLYDSSMVVLLSDHGEGFSQDPLVLRHGNPANRGVGQLHDVLIRIPFWMKLPGGRDVAEPVRARLQITDVFPLLFRHLNLKAGERSVGPGLPSHGRRVLSRGRRWSVGSTMEGRTYRGLFPRTVRLFVRGEGFKLLRRPGLPEGARDEYWAVGDLPGAPERFLRGSAVPDTRVRDLRDRMNRFLGDYHVLRERRGDIAGETIPEELRERLRGLGYFDG